MAREPLDLQKIRRNWERSGATISRSGPDRFASVAPPLDPFATGQLLLERLQREIADTFPEHRQALAPFLGRAETSFAQLRERTTPDGLDAPEAAKDLVELREQLNASLRDLEDICEAFLGLKR